MLSQKAFYQLRREHMPAMGAAKAYHESQSRIFSTEAPQLVGAGEGTDNLDFLAALSAQKVINPDAIHKAAPSDAGPVPESPSPFLSQLTFHMLTVPGARKPLRLQACLKSTTMKFIMWCCSHHVVHCRQCSILNHHGNGAAAFNAMPVVG